MSHFYARIPQSGRKTMPTARGHKSTGISAEAMSYNGRIRVNMYHDDDSGEDWFEVEMLSHPETDTGDIAHLVSGRVGDLGSVRGATHYK
jgi:hypothetical protein